MASTLLDLIEQAEQQADDARQDAAREAREIIKAVEEANTQMERQQTRDMHEAAQRRLDAIKMSVCDEIKALELRRQSEREAMKRLAQAKVSEASIAVFERVVGHGNR